MASYQTFRTTPLRYPEPSRPRCIFAVTRAFTSPTDTGETWKNLTRNLPKVPIVDLVYHETDGTLTAASYGRSLWRLKV